MTVCGIHHVTLIVDDAEKAAWFYGQILGLEEKPRPAFDFPGLFFRAGQGQEIHLIVAARPLGKDDDVYIRTGNGSEFSLRHIHRHAALRVTDLAAHEQKLKENGTEVLFSAALASDNDDLAQNMLASWRTVYAGTPIFCRDPFGNLLELVPVDE